MCWGRQRILGETGEMKVTVIDRSLTIMIVARFLLKTVIVDWYIGSGLWAWHFYGHGTSCGRGHTCRIVLEE